MTSLLYLGAALCFVYALRGLAHPTTSRRGLAAGIVGMLLAVATTFQLPVVQGHLPIIVAIAVGGVIGAFIAWRIAMTALPQLVAGFHSLVGLAAVMVAITAFYQPEVYGIADADGNPTLASLIEMGLGVVIGAMTFSGSLVAFSKLQGLVSGAPLVFVGQHLLNLVLAMLMVASLVMLAVHVEGVYFWSALALALILGVTLIVPIGGADMPVVVSMLNSYSGWAAAGIGFTLSNHLLIIVGALVGSSGAILSYIMCKGMNRPFLSVILGGFGQGDDSPATEGAQARNVKAGNADDAAFIMKNAARIIIVPGYGMAVAQAQHAVHEMAQALTQHGAHVRYAIHPVAGRMPGHMNVLLAEANVSYDDVLELDDINNDFASTDVAFVIGANDITNPAARNDTSSAIYGMPILNVDKAATTLFVKRSLGAGYAGIENELFFQEKTMMLFGDAKKMVEGIIKAL
ncbi:MAG: NAD(P)(+) transhydrogenase (Re/Si-specific) subunit beta [Alphaproteobacteria bacterium GM202ARS2]|nr:NAD(P)(+) transhydrogenase (Re/Si-specific) subunit beta [Alphaproteobacteria bacterium GM202ARS2]